MRADASTADATATPRVRFVDHLRVAWLLCVTVAGVVPWILFTVLAPLFAPWMRRRLRRRLAAATPATASDPDALRTALGDFGARSGRLFLVAGEASGDRLAAPVVRALRRLAPETTLEGYAGPACAGEGMHLHRDLTAHAVMGVWAVLGTLGFWWRICAETLARFRDERPDVLVTVDFPGLNIRLARWARRAGIRTVHVVAPQVWAHGPWRVGRVRRAVDHLLSIMPFEPPLFAASGIPTTFVGHPLFEAPLDAPRSPASAPGDAAGQDAPPVVELWPGSRGREIRPHVPILKAAAIQLAGSRGPLRFVIPLADPDREALVRRTWEAAPGTLALPALRSGPAPADATTIGALVTSGTATAQVAVDLVPQVVFYRVGRLTRFFSGCVLTTPWLCLANLVAGRTVAPEHLVVGPGDAPVLVRDLERQIRDAETYRSVRAGLEEVRRRLSVPSVAERTALVILGELPRA